MAWGGDAKRLPSAAAAIPAQSSTASSTDRRRPRRGLWGAASQLQAAGPFGIGEASTIGSTPAEANDVCNALAPLGIHHFDVQVSPLETWQMIEEA